MKLINWFTHKEWISQYTYLLCNAVSCRHLRKWTRTSYFIYIIYRAPEVDVTQSKLPHFGRQDLLSTVIGQYFKTRLFRPYKPYHLNRCYTPGCQKGGGGGRGVPFSQLSTAAASQVFGLLRSGAFQLCEYSYWILDGMSPNQGNMIFKPMLMKTKQMCWLTFAKPRARDLRSYRKICLGEIHRKICYVLHKCLVNYR